MARAATVSSPLGKDVFFLYRVTGTEELGRLFEFTLELCSNDWEIELDKVVGQNMTVTVDFPTGVRRRINGYVSRFSQLDKAEGGWAWYSAVLRPWPWLLTRTANCRIHQEKTVPDILKAVFDERGFTDLKKSLSSTYRNWEYCVQYGETDFDFVSRLMEHEGIYYYFKHEDGRHHLVLADSISAHETIPGDDVIFRPPSERDIPGEEVIWEWIVSRDVQPGTCVLDDFDFEKPSASLLAKSAVRRKHPHADYEIYDYPGRYVQAKEGESYARARIEAYQAQYEQVRGTGNAPGMAAGMLFRLVEHPRKDQNGEYLIVSAIHELNTRMDMATAEDEGVDYACRFVAIPSKQPFRAAPITPKPRIQGPQTAIVVGKDGEEIWTDKYGRVKVQFHWDRDGKKDENSSCWVRVAQIWAGKSWGGMHIPRIGQEVVVDFLDGDPDRPIITGRVYNAESMPPYKLPDNQTQSGMVSRSTKDGDAKTFNELRFEDKKDAEEVYFHAEKDFNRVVENNDTLKVGLDKKDPGDQTIEIQNDRTVSLEEGNDKLDVKKGNRDVTVKGDQTLAVDGKRTEDITGNDTLTVKQGNKTIKISAGKGTWEAAQSIELKVGASSIKIEPAKITLKSPQIAIQADAKLDAKAAIADVNASAMLQLKGGMIKIN